MVINAKHLVLKSIVICALTFFVALMTVSDSYAITDVNVTPIGSASWCINGSYPTDATVTCHLIQNLNSDITVVANNMLIYTQGSYYTDTVLDIELTFYRNSNTTSDHTGINGIEMLNTPNWALMSYEYQQLNSNTGVVHLYLKSLTNNNSQNILISGHQSFFYVLQPGDRVAGANVGIYAINNTQADYSSIISAINNNSHDYSQSLNSINSGINSINNNIQDVQDSVDDLGQTQQDIYDDEKDTINQNSEDAQDSAEDLDISFTVPNILNPWLGLFKNDACVDVSNLASWLHWDGDAKLGGAKTVCSPWPTSVRSVLTPIFSFVFMLVLFRFVIKWLSNSTEVY